MFFAFKRVEWHLSVTQPSPIAAFVTKVARPTDAPKKRTIISARRLCIIFSLTKERFKNQKKLLSKYIMLCLLQLYTNNATCKHNPGDFINFINTLK
jgi:hypothetical protein